MKTLLVLLSLTLAHAASFGAQLVDADVVVYGGAAGGVTAAVQTARLGKKVALVVFNNHLGGLSSGGLGQTDIGSNGNAYIQGMSREFYTRIGAKYGQGTKFTFEPKVAEAVFNEMVQQAGVPVYINERLASTQMLGLRIKQITMENGDVFRAKVFIDASYEGDLMKQAGVTYTAGREANSQYGETIDGIQRATSGNQLPSGIDPYVIQGNSASGLLPGVNADDAGPNGSADTLIQAFCYRMCLTNVAANRIAVPQPGGYNEADYEILFRAIEAGQTGAFWKLDSMPNGKTDSNNSSGISCDLIGGNNNFVEADYATRDAIAKAHERWQRGLIWTVQNHLRVPAAIRSTWAQWGLPADEFLDTDHWPHQLYVREARRMVSDYVMTEKNCFGTVVATDSIGLGSYTMDSHNCQRIVSGGMVKNEGDIQKPVPAPYPISYRSIVPKVGQCNNLIVPWSLSATHISFGSIRMEPVFMNNGQSAGTAACFAIDDNVAVQSVSYPKLKAQMLADGQALTNGTIPGSDIIVDNADATGVSITPAGGWTLSSATSGYNGANYLHDGNTAKGTKSVQFTPTLPTSGSYEVFLRWTADPNRATNVPVDVTYAGGTTTISPLINQQANGGQWVSLGIYSFSAGTTGNVTIRTTGTTGFVIADAVRFSNTTALPVVSLWATDSSTSESIGASTDFGRVTVNRTGSTNTALIVNLSIGGTATNGTDYSTIPSTITIPAGATTTAVTVTPSSDPEAEGDETVTIAASSSAGYTLDPLNDATIIIHDRPYDAWRHTYFTPQQLNDPTISGEDADPDGEGLTNIFEAFAGRNPTIPDDPRIGAFSTVHIGTDDYLTFTYTRVISPDLLCFPEVSSDLAAWSSGSTALKETVITDDGETRTIEARDLTPYSPTANRFIRLRVSRVP